VVNSDQFKNNFAYLIIGYYFILGIFLIILYLSGFIQDGLLPCILLICSFPFITSWLVVSEFISKTKTNEPKKFTGKIQKRFAYVAYMVLILLFLSNFLIITTHNLIKPLGSDIKFLTFLISSQAIFGSFYQWLSKEIFLK
jgi:hypothetical protein